MSPGLEIAANALRFVLANAKADRRARSDAGRRIRVAGAIYAGASRPKVVRWSHPPKRASVRFSASSPPADSPAREVEVLFRVAGVE